MVNPLARTKIVGVVIPQPARFGAVDEVLDGQRVRHGVELPHKAPLVEAAIVAVRFPDERERPDGIARNDQQERCEALVPKPCVQVDHALPVVLAEDDDHYCRHALDAEHSRRAQVAERGSNRAPVGAPSGIFRIFVEFRQVPQRKVEPFLPQRGQRLGLHGAHSWVCPRRWRALGPRGMSSRPTCGHWRRLHEILPQHRNERRSRIPRTRCRRVPRAPAIQL